MNWVALSLGSNLGNREKTLSEAIQMIKDRVGKIITTSSFVSSEPYGFNSIHPFINGAMCVHTCLSPQELLITTESIERELGRKHKRQIGENYSDRICDIDILLFNEEKICTNNLIIPHLEIHKRDFVLEPLASIAPKSWHPIFNKTILTLWQEICN